MFGQGLPPGKLSHKVIKGDLAISLLGWELPVVKISRCLLLALLVSPENSLLVSYLGDLCQAWLSGNKAREES